MPSHVVYWHRQLAGRNRKGEPCTILRQVGKLAQVRFEDGKTALVNRMGVRAAPKVGENNTPSS